MWFILGVLVGWLLLKQPEWSERQVIMFMDYVKSKLTNTNS
jgi:hypothetical protein